MKDINNLYVVNSDKKILKVNIDYSTLKTNGYIILNLEEYMAVDYVNIDNSDIQGYIFVETKKEYSDFLTVYIFEETIKDRLEEEGYKILDKLPKIYSELTEEEKEIFNII